MGVTGVSSGASYGFYMQYELREGRLNVCRGGTKPRYGTRPRYIVPLVTLTFVVAVLSLARSLQAQTNCRDLRHFTLPAEKIGLPTTGAVVTSAHDDRQGDAPFCKVMGRIHPVDPRANDIRFEVNLPEPWNGKAVHFGGGTFDGYLAHTNGRGRSAVGLKSLTTPLGQGFATFGSDSGHHRIYFPFPDAVNALNAKFARNPEQQRNFAGDAVKKVHDVAVALMVARYGKAPRRMYFMGGSTGGREALSAAERYGDDYDGVLAAYAAWNQIELDLQFIRTAQALYAKGGYLSYSKTKLIAHTVEKKCDGADGLRDGIVADPDACHVNAESFRCPDGKSHRHCLSDAQLHTLVAFATPQRTAMAVSHGIDSIPGYNVLSGVDLTGATGILPFPLHSPVFLFNSFGYVIGDDVLRNFLSVGYHYDALNFPVTNGGSWHDELLTQSREIDATDTNLSTFQGRGGKLLLVHGTRDNIIPTGSTIDFYQRLQKTMGAEVVASFARLYIIPGFGHGFGRYDAGFDTVGVLDDWVERGIAPANLVVTDNGSGRTRPLCDWPLYPRYNGAGSPKKAENFTCVASGQSGMSLGRGEQ